MTSGITISLVTPQDAADHLAELRALYADVYAEPPYQWGPEHTGLFATRFAVQCRQPGFALAEARAGTTLTGFGFGVTLKPGTPWWTGLTEPLPADITAEHDGRTFALVELLVRPPWRRQGIARALHDLLLTGRTEQRATLTVLPAAVPAQAAYRQWGWHQVARKQNPLPGSPVFDVLIKPLTPRTPAAGSS